MQNDKKKSPYERVILIFFFKDIKLNTLLRKKIKKTKTPFSNKHYIFFSFRVKLVISLCNKKQNDQSNLI